jgi:cardiolipin synthase
MAESFAELVVDGHRLLPALLKDIARAEHFIHVAVFLFFNDPIGREIAEALAQRARSGLAVRVLINVEKTAMGDPFSTGEKEMMDQDPAVEHDPLDVRPLCGLMIAAGVQVHDTNIDYDLEVPVHEPRLRSIAEQIRGGIAIDDLHVDHRKLIVLDGKVAWCGGANIGAQYLHHVPFDPEKDAKAEALERKQAGLPEPWWKWHDSLTRFAGPIAAELDAYFHERWVLDGGDDYPPTEYTEPPRAPPGEPVAAARIYANEPNDKPNGVRQLYLHLITSARRSIFIENPYLYHPEICAALCDAKTRRPTLDVVLVMPARRHNDNAFGQDAQEHEYARYLACGIAVYEYQNHFNHLKMAVFDERFSIHGSTNLNYRSLENDKDFELVVLVEDERLARWILTHVRDVDVGNARRVIEGDLHGTLAGLRRRVRDPRTLALLAKRLL